MAKGARDLGARIMRRNRVTGIRALPSGEWEVVTEQGRVIAETVVNAAGCFARQVAQMVGDGPAHPATFSTIIWSPARCRNWPQK